MLRYVWVFTAGSSFATAGKGDSFALGFDTKYYEQLEKIRTDKNIERKVRLQAAHERAQDRLEEQKIMKEKLDEQLKERDKMVVDKQYEDKIEKLENKFAGKGSIIATKRILKEYKHFQTSTDIENFDIVFKNGDNFYQWNVILDILHFELTDELRQDFLWMKKEQKDKDPTLEFEILFPSSFPFDPPFIRIVKPIYAFHTGHVTIGGSLCMESLTPAGWSSARSVEGLFIEILSIILQGGARLDKTRLGHCYSAQEAKAAFERVAKHHGWL
jgi:ubiquitin-protein ligase